MQANIMKDTGKAQLIIVDCKDLGEDPIYVTKRMETSDLIEICDYERRIKVKGIPMRKKNGKHVQQRAHLIFRAVKFKRGHNTVNDLLPRNINEIKERIKRYDNGCKVRYPNFKQQPE